MTVVQYLKAELGYSVSVARTLSSDERNTLLDWAKAEIILRGIEVKK